VGTKGKAFNETGKAKNATRVTGAIKEGEKRGKGLITQN